MRRPPTDAAALTLGAGTAVGAALAGAAVLRAVERRASTWFVPRPLDDGAAERGRRAVLVLGHADTGTTAGDANLARVRAALAVARPGDVLVLSGGGVAGPVPEARLLADAARDLGWNGEIRLEEHSGSTWENIENSARLLEDADRIVIVSEPVHAAKARRFLALQRPDLAARLLPTTTPDGEEPLPRAGAWGVLMGLIDLWLSEHVDGWAPDSAQGLAGVRRLVASRD
ncbi:YdcF family protein [Actinomyces radicidentis]|uniref:YdcF family protein n=1 Tax=Actinomyces radicidentis TaxID=111015 RepID=UPI0026DF8C61|nr:YdcF family protein [Actinomyces radicidentis]